ncbi:MAG: hypothetical protein AAF577_10380 [Pseudomonadota bacterium]
MIALLTGIASMIPSDEARAGAWTKEKGDGAVIVTIGRQATPSTLLTLGPASDDKATAQIYAEYGLFDGITVGASLFSETRIGDAGMQASANAAGFLRFRLHKDDQGNVAAVQIGGALPVESLLGGPFGGSNPDSTAEVRLSALAGTSWWGDWGSVFVTSAIGGAWRSEGAADEIRAELTAGYKTGDCCMVILGNFVTVPLIGRDSEDTIAWKLSPSFAYSLPPLWGEATPDTPRKTTLQLGATLEPMNNQDIGVTFSVWRRF